MAVACVRLPRPPSAAPWGMRWHLGLPQGGPCRLWGHGTRKANPKLAPFIRGHKGLGNLC